MNNVNYGNKIKSMYKNVPLYERGIFLCVDFKNTKTPAQGWKIHVSTLLKDAIVVLQIVFGYCLENKINFKFIKNKKILIKNQSADTDVFFFGKFITIYCENEDKLKTYINWFYKALIKFRGINIYSSRPYLDSTNVFYRYGTNYSGNPYLVGPNNQKIIDRVKSEYFLPPFVSEPFPENKSIFNYEKVLLQQRFLLLYLVQKTAVSTIFFSQDLRNKKFVILKSSPLYALTKKNFPLIFFRRNEARLLLYLEDNDFENSQKYVDDFVFQNNFYLCKSFVNGKDLKFILNNKNFLSNKNLFNNDFGENYRKIFKKTLECIFNFHKKNVVLNDVSSKNFICDSVKCYFIDLETSYVIGSKAEKIWNNKSLFNNKFPNKKSPFLIDILKLCNIFIESLIGEIWSLKTEFEIKWLFLSLYNFILFHNWPLWLIKDIIRLFFKKINYINKQMNLKLLNKNFTHSKVIIFKDIVKKIQSIYKIYNFKELPLKFRNFKTDFLYRIINDIKISDNLLKKLFSYEKRFKFSSLGSFSTSNLIFWGFWFFFKSKLNRLNNNDDSNDYFFQKIIDLIIEKRIKNNDGITVVGYKNRYSPYILDGSLGLCYLVATSKYKNKTKEIKLLEKSLLKTTSNKIGFFYGVTGFIHYFSKKKNSKVYYNHILNWIVFVLNFWDEEKKFFVDNVVRHNQKHFKIFNSLIIETIYKVVANDKNFSEHFRKKEKKIKYDKNIYTSIIRISKLFS